MSVDMFFEKFSYSRRVYVFSDRNKAHHLGQSVDDIEYAVFLIVCSGEWNNELHGDFSPICLRWV